MFKGTKKCTFQTLFFDHFMPAALKISNTKKIKDYTRTKLALLAFESRLANAHQAFEPSVLLVQEAFDVETFRSGRFPVNAGGTILTFCTFICFAFYPVTW